MEPYHSNPSFCWLRNLFPGWIAAGSDRGRWPGSKHQLDRIVRGPPLKTSLTDRCDFTQGHRWEFHTQVNDKLAHTWRQAPRRFLWLFAGPGCKQADHALLVKSIGFAL